MTRPSGPSGQAWRCPAGSVCTTPSVNMPRDESRSRVNQSRQHAESRRRQVRLSRQASASSLKLSQAPANMLGQCGSSSAKRCEHVEVTFSGWTCILRQGLEPALTRQSWLRALCFTALPAYYRSRPRTLAIKTRPGGPYLGAGEATMAWTDVHPLSGGGKGLT